MRIDGVQLGLDYLSKGGNVTALVDVDISLELGMLAVTGPSGCGKSSLLYVLCGLKKPTCGTVYYDDVDIESFSPDRLAEFRHKKVGFIFQRHFLHDYLSVLDNVLVPINSNNRDTINRANELLSQFDIAHLSKRKPYELSQGQRQRVAVARSLINHPEVIFADEPTAALDRNSTDAVMTALTQYSKHATIFLITHDTAVLERADKVVLMNDGRIVSNTKNHDNCNG